MVPHATRRAEQRGTVSRALCERHREGEAPLFVLDAGTRNSVVPAPPPCCSLFLSVFLSLTLSTFTIRSEREKKISATSVHAVGNARVKAAQAMVRKRR